MSRQEYKFLINNNKEINWIKKKFGLKKKYISRKINSYYFDTVDLSDYIDSEEGTVPRKKVRFRWYGKKFSKKGNFEIKRTLDIKRTKEKYQISNYTSEIKSYLKMFNRNYTPTVKISYDREYYFSKKYGADFTFDTNIFFERINKDYNKISRICDQKKLLEVKIDLAKSPDDILGYLNFKRVRNSKYCNAIQKTQIC
jgi:hypothetical protein